FIAGDRDIGGLDAVVLLPCGKSVLPRWQVRQRGGSGAFAYVEVVRLKYGKLSVHPGMDVALHRDKFRLVVFGCDWWSAGRLRLIPLDIDFGQGVNVVRWLVVVYNLQFLIGVHFQKMRNVLAALLIKGDGLRGNLAVIRSAGGNIDDYVFQSIVGPGNNRFCGYGCSGLFRTTWFLAHVDGLGLGGGT